MARERLRPDAIERALEESAWPCHPIAEGTFRSVFRGPRGSFPVLIRIDPAGFLVIAIVPYVRWPTDEARAAALYVRLLELNHELLMAKFSIDDDLDVVLSVEYALPELDRSELKDALDVLSYYADRYYPELRQLAGSVPSRGA